MSLCPQYAFQILARLEHAHMIYSDFWQSVQYDKEEK